MIAFNKNRAINKSKILIRLSPPLVPAKRNHNNRIISGSGIKYYHYPNNYKTVKKAYLNLLLRINDLISVSI